MLPSSQNQGSNETPNSMLRAYLSNPKIGTDVDAAVNSPIGSTARATGNSLASITRKAIGNSPYIQQLQKSWPSGASSLPSYGDSLWQSISSNNPAQERKSGMTVFPNAGLTQQFSQPSGQQFDASSAIKNFQNGPLMSIGTSINPKQNEAQPTSQPTPPTQEQASGAAQIYGTQQASGTPVSGAASYSASSVYSPLSNAVGNNIGASGFAYSMMNDKDALRKLPGFESVPDDALPYGASLVNQVDALADTLRKSYNLDSLINQKTAMARNGVMLESDLTDYIRGRDEFLNQTDQMLESFKDKVLTMDTSDPFIATQAQNYSNYLYTLRGRQNKRYIEFVNTSINQYEAQTEALTSTLNTALDAYENELQTKSGLAEEEYNMYYNALSSMYEEAVNAPIRKLEIDKLTAEINRVTQQTLTDAAGASTNTINYIEEVRDLSKDYITEDGKLAPTISSLSGTIGNAYASGYSPLSAGDAVAKGMAQTLYSSETPDQFFSTYDKFSNMAYDLYNDAGATEYGYNSIAGNIAESLKSSGTEYLRNSLKNSGNSEVVKEAAMRLTGESKPWFNGTEISREDFKNKYEGKLNSTLLDWMYSSYQNAVSAGAKSVDAFGIGGIKGVDDDTAVNNVVSRIGLIM